MKSSHSLVEIVSWRRRLASILVLILAWLASPLAADDLPTHENVEPSTTVILVRHAEKVAPDGDPPLSDAGKKRAEILAHTLGEAGVGAIYATPYRRTQETAKPLALRLGLEVRIAGVGNYGPDLAAKIRAEHRGQVVVAISHSNTVPELIASLGIEQAPEIPDHAYDDLFIVTLPPGEPPTLLALAYGEPTP